MIGYQGQVIAAIMAGFVLVYLEKFFRKICPQVISMIVVPFCSLLPAVIIAHTIVGPIGWKIGNFIADVVYGGLTSGFGVLFAGVFGLLYAPIVMTGLHHMTNAIDSQLVSMYDGTILWPMIALSNIAQGSAVLAMAVLQKKNDRAKQINIPACISCYLGVTEPALFGVNLKYVFPLVCGMIGSAIAAMVSVGFGVQAVSIGVGGIPGILSIYSQYWGIFLVCMLIAIVVPFALTFLVGSRKLSAADRYGEADENAAASNDAVVSENVTAAIDSAEGGTAGGTLKSPLDGRIIPIEEIPDEVFSQKIMGDGVGIEPTGNTVYAPADATVGVVMADSKHACGLVLDNGMEILIHVGIDTVDMNGDGFELFVKEGDRVKTGDPLISFTPEKIKAAGHPMTTAFLITDNGSAADVRFKPNQEAKAGQTVIAEYV